MTYGLNTGYRWIWNNGINLTFLIGYGLYNIERKYDSDIVLIRSFVNVNVNDFLSPINSEFSAGYGF